MARQVLENGVVLPAEYSDDWYDDMTSNLTKLDDVIGSDSEKLSSADVGAAALSNNYNDLDNLPTIPTVNDATLTIQKNGVDVQTFTANASSNVTANITVPTKTSDLTNDSNFVDTSNSAVASGITSAKVTSYDSHIADTDIHVTTADKTKWNNGVSQAYVFRYSSTALVASSTNSNTLLDNTDNLKVGDKVIDSDGVLFSITAIDSVNGTFTVGSALVDLALDGNVVHTSGNETVGGVKTFDSNTFIYNSDTNATTPSLILKNSKVSKGSSSETGAQMVRFYDKDDALVGELENVVGNKQSALRYRVSTLDSNNQPISIYVTLIVSSTGSKLFCPGEDNGISLGGSTLRWSRVYGTEYYYGSNNVEFSIKFVTSDTTQTISGDKSFSSDLRIANTDTTSNTPNLNLRNYKADRGTTDTAVQTIGFLDKNAKALTSIESRRVSNGNTATNILCYNTDDSNNTVSGGIAIIKGKTDTAFAPTTDNAVTCGRTLAKWSDVQTYKVNGLTPSSLSLPDLSNSIDISSYITDLTGSPNVYSSPANGYIVLRSTTANVLGIVENTTGMGSYIRGSNQVLAVNLPVIKNSSISIYAICSSLTQAKFIPCQGNV